MLDTPAGHLRAGNRSIPSRCVIRGSPYIININWTSRRLGHATRPCLDHFRHYRYKLEVEEVRSRDLPMPRPLSTIKQKHFWDDGKKAESRVVDTDGMMKTKENLTRTSSDNFMSFFLTLCEEYDVSPLPKLWTIGGTPVQLGASGGRTDPRDNRVSRFGTPTKDTTDNVPPVIYATYDNPKSLSNLNKLECRGYEISVCMLDALSESIKRFDTVTTIRLSNCRINAFGISQIAQILTEVGCVRDLNLDTNPNIRQNYYLLCAPSAKLEYLSLRYCDISDEGVEKIANELRYREEGELPQLIGLNLANNCFTDVAARHIADMLHTNRSLQSLTLTGNRIGDYGAALIIQELCMYALTHDEIVKLRRLNYKRLLQGDSNTRSVLSAERASEPSGRNSSSAQKTKTPKRSLVRKKSTSSKRSVDNEKAAATTTSTDVNSANVHPLSAESRPVKGEIMAGGNFELQHLNLSYNHLSDESLRKLVKCIFYQSYMMLGDTSKGLLYVHLEGNDFRLYENGTWDQLQELLRNRRSPRSEVFMENDYASVVPVESQILRRQFNDQEAL